MPALVVALLGAAGTGKTTLARQLETALATQGCDVVVVDGPSPAAAADLTLLMALDLPAASAALPAAATDARERVDARLRQALVDADRTFSVVAGRGTERLVAALAAVQAALRAPATGDAASPRWQHLCARCGDPDCERHRLPRT